MLDNFKFHHIGIATNSINKTSDYYVKSGFQMTDKIFDPIQNVNICFLNKLYHPQIELIEPLTESSPITKILDKSGVSLYHTCYEVDDIQNAIKELKKNKFILLFNPVIAVALEESLICFLYNKEIGLIELVQTK